MMLSGDIPPNQTIYIKNLNEKLKKEELKRSLYCLFSQFGRIVDVVALKTPKLRGQAWVCFSEITAASNAVRQMQNFPFYDKPIRIQYAKSQSECIAKLDEDYKPKDFKKKLAEKKRLSDEGQQSAAAAAAANNGTTAQSNGGASGAYRKPAAQEAAAAPNSILFVQNLPRESNSSMLQMLFLQYPGFREVRMIDAKPGIAFVEFEDENQSAVAMQALQGFKTDVHHAMEISYAKK